MRGLLIKDIKLLLTQKTTYSFILLVAIGYTIFSKNAVFSFGFLPFISIMLATSTISYDEFDNGYPFLFTLPFSRKNYVISKYILAVLLIVGSLAISILIGVATNLIQGVPLTSETFLPALFLIPILVIVASILIPFQLKYGADKGRIAIFVAVAIAVICGVVILKLFEVMNINIDNFVNSFTSLTPELMILIAFALILPILFLSIKIGQSIMLKKEF